MELNNGVPQARIKVYKRRWVMLCLYFLVSSITCLQWTQYSTIADVVVKYYNVSYEMVNWSSLIFLVVFIVFMFPGNYVLNVLGLRNFLLLTSCLQCAGCWLKVVAVNPNRFWLVLDSSAEVGKIELLEYFMGCVGLITTGIILDKFKRFKTVIISSQGVSFILMVIFTCTLHQVIAQMELNNGVPQATIKVYKRRWVMLCLYFLVSSITCLQWTQYSIIADVVVKYYNVSYEMVNWSSMIFLVVFIVFMFPGNYILNVLGLRNFLLLTSCLQCAGCWLKVVAVNPNRFWLVLVSQVIIGITQVSILTTPSLIAITWFGINEISTATSIEMLSMQISSGLGFFIPVLTVSKTYEENFFEQNLFVMVLSIAILSTICLFLVFLFFENKPRLPPSEAESHHQTERKDVTNIIPFVKHLLRNFSFISILLICGINTGIGTAIDTLLNQIIVETYKDSSAEAGKIELLKYFMGCVGLITTGIILDKFKRFKTVIISSQGVSFILMGLRNCLLLTSTLQCVGCWLKVVAVNPNRFWLVLVSQTIFGLTQVSILSTPSLIAITWFGINEISTATSIGTLSLQISTGLSFFIPAFIISNTYEEHVFEKNLFIMVLSVAIFSTTCLISVFLFFENKPRSPPSEAQLYHRSERENVTSIIRSVKHLFKNFSFISILLICGISNGIGGAIDTLLNQIIVAIYKDSSAEAGKIELLEYLMGCVGLITTGIILDKFKRFKTTIICSQGGSLVLMAAFTYILHRGILGIYIIFTFSGWIHDLTILR
ncbi:hypothetical protein FQA39_LY11337 [Lamprigera yunnana]|nr:hypothetical protein FQA39_LY11337 [Lamprigera yunnana]